MQGDGARLTKFKEVFKRAIQEILKEETVVREIIMSPQNRDSFYSDSAVQLTKEDIKNLFSEIKSRFSEIFKQKIRKANLDTLLNNLDKDINESRTSYKDIRNMDYVNEIFESHVVDKKEEFVRYLEENIEKYDNKITQLNSEIADLNDKITELNSQNESYENEYLKILSEMESICIE